MSLRLDDLVCLITGADEGVGRGLVDGFAQRGARVAAGLLDVSRIATTPSILPLPMDVTHGEQVRAAVEHTVQHFGRIDLLINNAGIYPRSAADEITLDKWRRMMDINLDGTWRCCEAVIPHMKRQRSGVILNVGSIGWLYGQANLAHYHASKAGVVGLTRGLARDLGKFNIRVNCLNLGAIETEGERRVAPDAQGVLKFVEEKQSLPGRLTPQTIEPVFAFFASPLSGDITGQSLTVDRGWVHG